MKDHLVQGEEHERRFLVDDLSILKGSGYFEIEQAYLWADNGYAVRVRLVRNPDAPAEEPPQAYLTLKGPREWPHVYMRYEIEQSLDPVHAQAIVGLAPNVVTKNGIQ